MKPIQNNIREYLNSNKISTVCFVDKEGNPYCINCFYAFDETNNLLIFKSSLGTTHHEFIKPAGCVSGTILPNKIDFLKIKGVQFLAKLLSTKEVDELKLSFKYIKQHPMSIAIGGYIWAARLEFVKLTDNTLGFGNKITWNNK
jgi:uncharacterized protein YhbP (UPF0306 family)